MAHRATDVVRTYEFTDADLMARLGLGGQIVGFGFDRERGTTRIVTTMIHPEDSRFTMPLVEGEVCRTCGAAPGQPHAEIAHPRQAC